MDCRPPGSSVHGIFQAKLKHADVHPHLRRITTNQASGEDGILAELLQILTLAWKIPWTVEPGGL